MRMVRTNQNTRFLGALVSTAIFRVQEESILELKSEVPIKQWSYK
jgi:hypothetical protein